MDTPTECGIRTPDDVQMVSDISSNTTVIDSFWCTVRLVDISTKQTNKRALMNTEKWRL